MAFRRHFPSLAVGSAQRRCVRFVLSPPLILKKNQTRLLELKADVRASRSRTIQLIIEEPGDIEAERANLR